MSETKRQLEQEKIVLGVCGGISAYKSVEVARLLKKEGADVKVVMTEAGQKFVSPLTFRTITGNPLSLSLWADPSLIPHISLSDEARIILVAPATANMIAKCALGMADDLLSTTILAARGKVLMAPAMNTRMYLNPATRENLRILRERGIVIIEPGEGELACGEEGIGRMAEPSLILSRVEEELCVSDSLSKSKFLITAGPTREFVDPVRFISNPSSGKMGFTVAEEAQRRGADVLLISGPVNLSTPTGVERIDVTSSEEMKEAVLDNLEECDVLVMAAAVSDFRPVKVYGEKMKKADDAATLELERTPDILMEVKKIPGSRVVVGFAAETENIIDNAKKKLVEKGMDLIVANSVSRESSAFSSDGCLAAILSSAEDAVELESMAKRELAAGLIDRIGALLEKRCLS
ncbi:MAG: bifunctional phosphopantothenoylcysteine decarboxylase/phosphopantothenate--cysteine ligase CoaBC [Actinomycetota bacterium]|nr:bifunctional phosphopantothenoylcysteine decarboxylase/phosphopantothenate--cysteine ligase CoaBC [Actinomycetota bacterium]